VYVEKQIEIGNMQEFSQGLMKMKSHFIQIYLLSSLAYFKIQNLLLLLKGDLLGKGFLFLFKCALPRK